MHFRITSLILTIIQPFLFLIRSCSSLISTLSCTQADLSCWILSQRAIRFSSSSLLSRIRPANLRRNSWIKNSMSHFVLTVIFEFLHQLLSNRTTVVCRSFRQCARQSDTPYLCHFATEMAEIWSPATSCQDVFVYKISALYHLYFQSYKAF